MPLRNQFPTSLRYLKARLQFIKRPMFWGASVVLVLATFFIAEYWTHPEWFQVDQSDRTPINDGPSEEAANQSASDGLPPSEDNAIGADIDSLPLLFDEIQGFGQNGTSDSELTQAPDDPSSLFSDQLLPAPGSSESELEDAREGDRSLLNPFASNDASNDLPSSANFSNAVPSNNSPSLASPSLSLPSFGRLSSPAHGTASSSQGSVQPSGNPLQSALERYNSPAPSTPQQFSPNSSSTASPSPSSSGVAGQNQTIPSSSPYFQTSPAPGTTGYTLPPTLTVPSTSSPSTSGRTPSSLQRQPGAFTAPSIVPPVAPNQSGTVLSPNQFPGTGVPNVGAPAYTPPPQSYPQPQSSQTSPSSAIVSRTGPNYLPGARQFTVSPQ
ncbi:MAG TPA: hypothetical protein ACFE0H_10930 [Elainellaceae cyanobacterium]